MTAPARVLVTGAAGQLGRALTRQVPAGFELTAVTRAQLDVGDRAAVRALLEQLKPAVVINAAAYTAVDKAETDWDAAFRINRDAVGHVAEAAEAVAARVVHLSTDYVFDGTQSTPYRPGDAPHPVNVYGESKLAGEHLLLERAGGNALILRTQWVYAAEGANFLRTMQRLLRERPEVRVVADQVGTPTHAGGLARAVWALAAQPALKGIFHWSDAGAASWYDFAVAIRRELARREPSAKLANVVPIPTQDYPTPARRPAYALLDKGATWQAVGPGLHWEAALGECLA